jgi:amino acid adenylation domain-containing protein
VSANDRLQPAATSALGQRLAELSPEKRALLEQRLLARSQPADAAPPITPRASTAPAELSYVQELMWLLHEMDPGTYAYNSSGARRLRGPLDADALERAINLVIARHSALRTTFELRDGRPVQVIHDDARLTIERIPAPGLEGEELGELLRRVVRRPFDLTRPLLLRATLIEIGPEDHVLLTSADHIVWDGWSKGIFFSELAAAYDAYCEGREPVLPELAIEYADYAVWQREWLSGERMSRQLEYWRGVLAGAPTLLDLPTDHPRPAVASHRGDRVELWIPATTLRALRELARRHRATEFMFLVAAWSTLLSRMTGQDDIVLGTPIAGRNRPEVEGLIGYFNNTLALRVDLSGDPTFVELLGRVRELALSAYTNQDVSFEHVVREVAPQRDASYSPVFQSLIVLQNASQDAALELRDLEMEMIVTESGTAKFDLSIGMAEHHGDLHASFEYNLDLFDAETVHGVVRQFAGLVDALVADPEARLSELSFLTEDEQRAVLRAGTGPVADVPVLTLHELIAARAAQTPESDAVIAGPVRMSYGELDARTAAVARAIGERGLGPGDRVGLCMERSADLIVSMVGILRSGAAVVALDCGYPPARLLAMCEAAELRLVIVDDAAPGELGDAERVRVDTLVRAGDGSSAAIDRGRPDDPAFVIFTSGSTGRPKGVVLGHRGLVNHALAAIDLYGLSSAERTLQFASISFDISVEEIFTTLLAGATLVLREDTMPLGGPGFVEWLEQRQITFMDLPTAFWHEWVRDLERRRGAPPSSLRRLVVGGEKASMEAWQAWRRIAPGVRWFNTYGPTEASVIATAFEPDAEAESSPSGELPIGRALPNVTLHVLDGAGRRVPFNVPGELHIGGPGVAHGYLGLPAATADSFPVLGPDGERVYRTGDIVRLRRDGTVDFVGRTDEQIKLRGFRIEPAEVEAALIECSGVEAALVVVRGGDDPQLVAYVVGESSATEDVVALRREVTERLPAYAVPAVVMAVDAFPLTPNGKVDRDALPEPEQTRPQAAERVAPRNDTERVFVEIWSELLGTEVGISDDFFELGGHSMLAVRMLTEVEQRLGIRIRLALMLRTPTIRGLSEPIVDGQPGADAGWRALVEMKPEGTRPPLFLIHGLSGDVLIYRDLVRRLSREQPVWGLEALGADGRRVPMLAIPDMARHYISEMKTIQPQGPYFLAGHCYGGDLAHEIARQLEQSAEEVAFVGLIDANPLGLRPRRKSGSMLRQLIRRNLDELSGLPLANHPSFIFSNSLSIGKQIRTAVRWRIKKHVYLARGRPLPTSMVDMKELNYAALVDYVTPTYGGHVTLFRVHDPVEGERPRDIRMRWNEFAAGVDVRDIVSVGAGHQNVLYEPHAGVVATMLEQAIVETLAASAG